MYGCPEACMELVCVRISVQPDFYTHAKCWLLPCEQPSSVVYTRSLVIRWTYVKYQHTVLPISKGDCVAFSGFSYTRFWDYEAANFTVKVTRYNVIQLLGLVTLCSVMRKAFRVCSLIKAALKAKTANECWIFTNSITMMPTAIFALKTGLS